MKQEVFLPNDYRPAEDEPFMNDRQLAIFPTSQIAQAKRRIVRWNYGPVIVSAN
jgi:hypothetical protein